MNKKSIAAILALLALAAALLVGLRFTTHGILRSRMAHPVFVTATPAPGSDVSEP